MFHTAEKTSSYHLFPVRIKGAKEEQRDEIMRLIFDQDVSVNVHFIPVPGMSYYKKLGYDLLNIRNAGNKGKHSEETKLKIGNSNKLRLTGRKLSQEHVDNIKKSLLGNRYRLGGKVSDETRLKQLENYRRDFTANVSHELKTPLSAIKAYSETLLMGAIDDPDAAVRFVTSIGEQANRLDQLIRGLMQLSRIQTMPERLELAPIYLADIVRSVVREQSTVAESNQISIINHIEEDEFADDQLTVLAEHESLRTVFGNLLSNAIRYSKKGGTVEIKTEHTPDTIDLLVIDHGIGIPAEDINRIFERFYTVDKARSRDSGGTGLGLSIVKHLTAAIGGNIRVSSVLGSGSTFRVSLKRADLTPNEISAAI
jgi:signal transduction histidine kinase